MFFIQRNTRNSFFDLSRKQKVLEPSDLPRHSIFLPIANILSHISTLYDLQKRRYGRAGFAQVARNFNGDFRGVRHIFSLRHQKIRDQRGQISQIDLKSRVYILVHTNSPQLLD